MFGFGLKSKAKRIIREVFFYEVSYMYEPLLNNICQQGKMFGQNEYSIAIYYMTVIMNALVEDQKDLPGDLNEVDQFIKKYTSNINRIIHQANSPEADIRNMLEEVNNNFKSIQGKSEDKDTLKGSNFKEIHEEDDSNNPFEIGDENMSKLLNTMQPFSVCIQLSEPFFLSEIETKNLKITKLQISIIRAFQLLGALDYVGQSEGWTMEQLIVPFMVIVKEEPFKIDQEAAKILGLIGNPPPEIIQMQINGAHLFEEITNLISKGKEKFLTGMITVGRENASELSNLTSQALINTIKTISY